MFTNVPRDFCGVSGLPSLVLPVCALRCCAAQASVLAAVAGTSRATPISGFLKQAPPALPKGGVHNYPFGDNTTLHAPCLYCLIHGTRPNNIVLAVKSTVASKS